MADRSSPSGVATTARAAVVGALSFLFGYLVFYLLQGATIASKFGTPGVAQSMLEETGVAPPTTWELSGLFYFTVHKGSLQVVVSGDTYSDVQSIDPVFLEPLGENAFAYPWFVPILSLLLGGLVVARVTGPADSTEAAKNGGKMVLGYLVAVLVGVVLFRWSATFETGRSVAFGPKIPSTLLFAGFLYPLVVGSTGAFLGYGLLARVGLDPTPAGGRSPEESSDPVRDSQQVTDSQQAPDSRRNEGQPGPDDRDAPEEDPPRRSGDADRTPRYERTGESDDETGNS